ncbi:hypothetical protein [Halorubellus salinus]|uniref:hypothetical protein n=1 Tax=Halorubellus salinus TaxID=755309 RepID=UPI001D092466|nr:hypothetical protein [Halorubellus salinus]
MRPERDRSAVLGEAATVVVLLFGFRLAGEVAAVVLGWFVDPLGGTPSEVAATVTSAFAASLTWAGVVVAAAYIYLRVTRYRRTTPDPEEQAAPYGTDA